MSILMTAGKKAMQARIAAQKLKEKKKKSAAMCRESSTLVTGGEPPLSSAQTVVWYWQLNGVPTTVMYNKEKNEVWCNGYVLESMETFGDGFDCTRFINFGIYVEQLESIHDGRICCRLPETALDEVYELHVDGYLIPEHTSRGLSVQVNSNGDSGAGSFLPPDFLTDLPPRYEEAVYGQQPVFMEKKTK